MKEQTIKVTGGIITFTPDEGYEPIVNTDTSPRWNHPNVLCFQPIPKKDIGYYWIQFWASKQLPKKALDSEIPIGMAFEFLKFVIDEMDAKASLNSGRAWSIYWQRALQSYNIDCFDRSYFPFMFQEESQAKEFLDLVPEWLLDKIFK